jgi:hypothetical protein
VGGRGVGTGDGRGLGSGEGSSSSAVEAMVMKLCAVIFFSFHSHSSAFTVRRGNNASNRGSTRRPPIHECTCHLGIHARTRTRAHMRAHALTRQRANAPVLLIHTPHRRA